MGTANFAARKKPKLDFCRFRNVSFEKCSFSKRRPLPLFKGSSIRVGFAGHRFVARGSWEAGSHQLRAIRKWLAHWSEERLIHLLKRSFHYSLK
jgi:hypothetical protein